MKEADIRKWHRNFGIFLALFVLLQAASGLLLSLGDLSTPHAHADGEDDRHHEEVSPDSVSLVASVHHGGGSIGALYRIIVSIGMAGMAISGSLIYLRVKARAKPRVREEKAG